MTRIILVEASGKRFAIDADAGHNLMQVALDHGVAGLIGDCGGVCSCGTCQGFVDEAWTARLPPPAADEEAMLDGLLARQPNSRLCCQIRVSADLDGLVVRLPASQF